MRQEGSRLPALLFLLCFVAAALTRVSPLAALIVLCLIAAGLVALARPASAPAPPPPSSAEVERAADADRANQAKSEFLARMSHELRTPLAGIIGLAQAIGQGALDAGQRRHLSALAASADGMLELLNGILDLAKVEAGRMELE
ncbi:MAG: hypothetical protein K2W96_15540, partial [Gemmataceae bacterium]|nr:hypothetical protein [Gemmataceae bacterium]